MLIFFFLNSVDIFWGQFWFVIQFPDITLQPIQQIPTLWSVDIFLLNWYIFFLIWFIFSYIFRVSLVRKWLSLFELSLQGTWPPRIHSSGSKVYNPKLLMVSIFLFPPFFFQGTYSVFILGIAIKRAIVFLNLFIISTLFLLPYSKGKVILSTSTSYTQVGVIFSWILYACLWQNALHWLSCSAGVFQRKGNANKKERIQAIWQKLSPN